MVEVNTIIRIIKVTRSPCNKLAKHQFRTSALVTELKMSCKLLRILSVNENKSVYTYIRLNWILSNGVDDIYLNLKH